MIKETCAKKGIEKACACKETCAEGTERVTVHCLGNA